MTGSAAGAPRALPDEAMEGLRAAFAREVSVRVPHLVASAAELAGPRGPRAALALVADAHALASSATVLGERPAALAARSCEQVVLDWLDTAADAEPLPSALVARVRGLVDTVSLALAGWLPGATPARSR